MKVQKQTPEQNKLLMDGWGKAQAQAQEQERDRFAESQRAKGLILYRGEWLSYNEVRDLRRSDEYIMQRRVADDYAVPETYSLDYGPRVYTVAWSYSQPTGRNARGAGQNLNGFAGHSNLMLPQTSIGHGAYSGNSFAPRPRHKNSHGFYGSP